MLQQSRYSSVKKNVDWITIVLYAILVFMGWMSIYGASYDYEHAGNIFDFSQRYGKQLIWIALAGFVAVCILLLDARIFDYFAYYIYFFFILLLLATLVLATPINASRSWLVLGSVSIQPAEFAKFATALALAKYMGAHGFRLGSFKGIVGVGLLIFAPFAIIILQNETGSALVYVAFLLMLYREGLPGIVLFLLFWLAALFVVLIRFDAPIGDGLSGSLGTLIIYIAAIMVQFFILYKNKKKSNMQKWLLIANAALFFVAVLLHVTGLVKVNFEYVALFSIVVSVVYNFVYAYLLQERNCLMAALFLLLTIGACYSVDYAFNNILQPHQQKRVRVTLGLENDPRGAEYNLIQSKIAIGSGGFFGKGFLNGTQTKLKYVPEQDTDFIFCTVGEEFGFVGTTAVLLLFLTLILRLVALAERQRTIFARVYGYSLTSILFFHVAINIGMVIGLTPVIGIPLPFFSYGGSSLWGFTILLFVFIRMDASRADRWS